MTRTMPPQKPGLSKQDYGTPRAFLDACENRFGKIRIDLAAHARNHVVSCYYGPGGLAVDSLQAPWHRRKGVKWLNPPFAEIGPWAEKCAAWRRHPGNAGMILFLTPASVGAGWYQDFVYPHALTYFLRGRLSFDGKNPYPKDCILSVFGVGFTPETCELWDWAQ